MNLKITDDPRTSWMAIDWTKVMGLMNACSSQESKAWNRSLGPFPPVIYIRQKWSRYNKKPVENSIEIEDKEDNPKAPQVEE